MVWFDIVVEGGVDDDVVVEFLCESSSDVAFVEEVGE